MGREYHMFVTTSPPKFFPLNHPSHVRRPDALEDVLGGDVGASTVLEQYTSTFPPPRLIECILE